MCAAQFYTAMLMSSLAPPPGENGDQDVYEAEMRRTSERARE